jgi:hypothetical protein
MFRIKCDDHDDIIYVQSAEQIERVIRSSAPGRYGVDEMSTKPLEPGSTVRRWGIGIKREDGSVLIEPDP